MKAFESSKKQNQRLWTALGVFLVIFVLLMVAIGVLTLGMFLEGGSLLAGNYFISSSDVSAPNVRQWDPVTKMFLVKLHHKESIATRTLRIPNDYMSEHVEVDLISIGGGHITIDTAGTLYLPLECDLMSISPKLSNSTPSREEYPRWHQRHEASRYVPNTIRRLIQEHEYQFKFVIADPADILEVQEYLSEFPEIDRDRVLLMPEGCDATRLHEIQRWLDEDCRRLGFTVCPRRQIEWFGAVRGT